MGVLINKIELLGLSGRKGLKDNSRTSEPGLFGSEYSRWELHEIRYINGCFYKILVRESSLSTKRQFAIRKMKSRYKTWLH